MTFGAYIVGPWKTRKEPWQREGTKFKDMEVDEYHPASGVHYPSSTS